MSIHVPTMIILIIVTSLSFALSIGCVARSVVPDGLRPLTAAFALHAAAYVLLGLRGMIPDMLSIVLANMMIAGVYSLLLAALARFQQVRLAHIWLWCPALAAGALFGFFIDDFNARVACGSLVVGTVCIRLLSMLFAGFRRTPGRGQYLLVISFILNLLVLSLRLIVSLGSMEMLKQITDSSFSQFALYISAFVSMTLLGTGFVLMAKESAEAQAQQLAMQDRLTGCWTRFHVEALTRREMLRLRRYATPLSLILIDLDFFKQVNDSHGHLVGDAVLQAFAARVKTCIRDTDVLGRWGGEEFIVVLPSSGFATTAQIAERIRAEVMLSPLHAGISVTASLGFSSCQSTDTWEDWLGRADMALYRAKSAGRNRVESEMPLGYPGDAVPVMGSLVQLVWQDEYLSGVEEIDTQHRELFVQANRLLAQMEGKSGEVSMGHEIRLFIASMRKHMESEEALLARNGCPELNAHALLHEHLVERALQLLENYECKQLDIGDLLHFVVYELTAQHLVLEDGKLSAWLSPPRVPEAVGTVL